MVGLLNLYKILSLGFSYPEENNWDLIENQFIMTEDLFEGEVLSRLNSVREYFFENRHRIDEIKSEYLNIFDLGRKISPYETEYITEKLSRKPFELSDIAGFYHAFGLTVNEGIQNKEALDHISIELEFMAVLEWKELYAMENEQAENGKIVQDAKLKFFNDHLAKWGFFFCHQIYELEGDNFFIRLARLLEPVLILECQKYSLDVSIFNKPMSRDPYSGVRSDELTC